MRLRNFLLILCLCLASVSCKRTYQKSLETGGFIITDEQITPDSSIAAYIQPFKEKLEAKMNREIGQAAQPLPKKKDISEWESSLGNFVADLILMEAQKATKTTIDMGVITFGGLRTSLPAGAIQVRHIYELMPFENELLVIHVNASTVKQLFDYFVSRKNTAIANTKVYITQNTLAEVLVDEKPLTDRTYTIAISDYLANGGDDMHFLEERSKTETLNIKLRDAIIQHIEGLQVKEEMIKVVAEKRVIVK
ncbi:MAG: 5'-nucleotidase C-terminal domain-containing protein [Thermonemataceae bacterium]